jgi:thioredoxin-like negative regulator of GroEL
MPHTVLASADAVKKFKKANKSQVYVVLYHMSGCPHCIMMRPAWEAMLQEMSRDYFTAEVEYSHLDDLPESMRVVRGFPTIVAIQNCDKVVAEYNGDRGKTSLSAFVKSHAKKEVKKRPASAPAAVKPKAKPAKKPPTRKTA